MSSPAPAQNEQPPAEPAAAPEANTPPAPPAAPPPGDTAPPATPPAEPPADPKQGDEPKFDQAYVSNLRQESAKYRTRAQEAQAAKEAAEAAAEQQKTEAEQLKAMLEGIQKALNPNATEEEPPDPAKLAEQLAAVQADSAAQLAERDKQIRELTVKAALPTVYQELGAKPGLTNAVLQSSGVIAALDPTSDSFTADLTSAVKKALEANPELKIAPVAVRSGAEIPGGTGSSDQLTLAQVKELAKRDPAALEKARKEGRLKNVLSGGGRG